MKQFFCALIANILILGSVHAAPPQPYFFMVEELQFNTAIYCSSHAPASENYACPHVRFDVGVRSDLNHCAPTSQAAAEQ